MFLLLHVADRTTITCSPSLFIYLSLSLHLSVALTHRYPCIASCLYSVPQIFAQPVVFVCSKHSSCTLHMAVSLPFTHIMSVCLQFLFFPHSFFFSLIPFSLNVRDLIVYRNHKFGCHSGARCVSFLTFWSRGTKYNKVWRIILNVIIFYFFRKCPGATVFSKHEERFSNLFIEGLYSGL